MKTILATVLACATLLAPPLSSANQVTDFSVFQPINGISANIYIEHSRVMVQSTGAGVTALKNIKAEYLSQYSDRLYKIGDVDHNGTVDIATLDRVDRAATRFCYNVYSYHLGTRKFATQPTHRECSSAAGTVVYVANQAFVNK